MTAAANEAETAHPVQEDFDFLINFFYYLLQFWGVHFYFGFRK